MAFFGKCSGFITLNNKGVWQCKRCGVGGQVNPKHDVQAQIDAQFPDSRFDHRDNERPPKSE
jgi:hypothetical protein